MRIAFWGTSSFVGSLQNAEILEELVRAGVRPAMVITTPPREPGAPGSPVKAAADALGVPVREPASLQDFAKELTENDVTFVTGLSKLRTGILIPVSYTMNFLGIFAVTSLIQL